MNTSTRQRYTVITLTADQVNELRQVGWQKTSNVQALISHQYTEKHCYVIYGFYVNDQLFYTCILKEITGKSEIKAAVKSTVKPAEVKPAEVNTNKIIFEVGQNYWYGYSCGDTVVTIEIVKRTDKTVTFRDKHRNKLITRKINHYDLMAESIYPNKSAVCSAKDKVIIN